MTPTTKITPAQSMAVPLKPWTPQRRSRWPYPRPRRPVLRFSPTAWAKLQFFCHHGETEIGGFGISRPDDLLLIESFQTVKQRTSAISVAFDDHAVAEFFEAQVDAGRKPEQFARIWLHTHPGDSAIPSGVDEETFERVFGACQWAVMFVLARGGKTYARLQFNTGPKGGMLIPADVDYRQPFPASDHAAWRAEYEQNIKPEDNPVWPIDATGLRLAEVQDALKLELLEEDPIGEPPDPWDGEREVWS